MNFKIKTKNIFLFKYLILILYVGLFFDSFEIADSASQGHLLISQVQILEGAGMTEYDFIEIFNPTREKINLKGYRLVKRAENSIKDTSVKSWDKDIFLESGSYFLWANTEYRDYASAYMEADASTSATIANNNGVALRFGGLDTGSIIDSVAWGEAKNIFIEGSVIPSNPGHGQSLERKNKNNFLNAMDTNNNNNDFEIVISHPRSSYNARVEVEGGASSVSNQVTPVPQNTVTPAPSVTPVTATISIMPNPGPTPILNIETTYPQVVRINEFLPDPIGDDNNGEWIELFNNSDQDVNLSGYEIDDEISEGSKSYKIDNLVIKAFGYAVFPYKQTKITLNNGGGEVNFITPDGKLAEKIFYTKAVLGSSYNYFDEEWHWCKNVSPMEKNRVCTSRGKVVDNSNKSDDVDKNTVSGTTKKQTIKSTDNSTETEKKDDIKNTPHFNIGIEGEAASKKLEKAKGEIANTSAGEKNVMKVENLKSENESLRDKVLKDRSSKNSLGSYEVSGTASALNGDKKIKSIVPYALLIMGLGIIFALVFIRVKEKIERKRKTL